jgi:uncharacterized protein YutE (UPF0331/DUF86 family)
VVDEERVTRLAGGVLDDLSRLRKLAQNHDLAQRPEQLDATKYRFITAIEGCVAIAHHVVASEGWAVPETNAAAMLVLGERGVIGSDLASTMSKASGFRNLLVHQYGEIDDAKVVGFLDRLDELERFVQQVLTWISTSSPGS